MNIYVPDHGSSIFLEKLKEIHIVDDYKLDTSRFGKKKICLQSPFHPKEQLRYLFPHLPIDTVLVYNKEYPGEKYLLGVGEIHLQHIPQLLQESWILSILTKKEDYVRFNAWVPYDELEHFYETNWCNNITSLNGKIDMVTTFLFEADSNVLETLQQILSPYNSEMIIKENGIQVKLLLQNFTKLYPKLRSINTTIHIIDEE